MKKRVCLLLVFCLLCMGLSACGSGGINTSKGTEGLNYQNYDGSYWVTGYSGESSDIIIPDTYEDVEVVGVAEEAFLQSNIQSIVFGVNCTTIGSTCFRASSLLKEVTITAPGEIVIESYAFADCTSLEKFELADKDSYLSRLEEATFWNCESLSELELREGLTSLGLGCLKNTAITTITLPESLEYIGEQTFSGCTSLSELTIPAAVIRINDAAFRNCTSLTSLTIPATVEHVGYAAFEGFESNQTIIIEGSTDGWEDSSYKGYPLKWDNECDAQIIYQ